MIMLLIHISPREMKVNTNQAIHSKPMMVLMWLLKLPPFYLSLSQTGLPSKLQGVLLEDCVETHSLRSEKQDPTRPSRGLHERT